MIHENVFANVVCAVAAILSGGVIRRQANTWTNDVSLSIGPSGTSFSEISIIFIHIFIVFESVVCESGDHFATVSMC